MYGDTCVLWFDPSLSIVFFYFMGVVWYSSEGHC